MEHQQKRIYADWTKPNAGWKTVLLEYAITQFKYSYTVGKNSSDSAMIIDAMDLLYSDKRWVLSFLVILISQD
jgi:hypothetical protein